MIEFIHKSNQEQGNNPKKINITLETQINQKNLWLNKIKLEFVKYLVKSFVFGSIKLEYASPLSILQNHNAEISENREESKMLSSNQGGHTSREIYDSALALAKQFSLRRKWPSLKENFERQNSVIVEQQPKTSTDNSPNNPESSLADLITNKINQDLKASDVIDDEINQLKPNEAWELLQKKKHSFEIKESNKEKIYTTEEISQNFTILYKIWDEAFDRMDNANDSKRTSEILDITVKEYDDTEILENLLNNESNNLKPEEKFFISISIEIKKFRGKVIQLLVGNKAESQKQISIQDYNKFVDTGNVSESILHIIAEKIILGKQISKEEISIFSEKSKEIEAIINNKKIQ